MLQKSPKLFYERDTICVAKELLGKYLIHNYLRQEYIGKIVEVEAYLGEHDLSSHSSKGITPGTKVLASDTFYVAVTEKQHPFTIVEKPRVGVHYAKDWAEKLLPFYIKDNAFISKP
jgi:3-methyladenine DNA glycosylase Mpg